MDIVKIGLLGVTAVGIAAFIRQGRSEYAYLFILATGLFLFYLCFDALLYLAEFVREIGAEIENYDSYIQVLFKIVGITYISEFCSGMCKDAGYCTIGNQIEVAGKISILLAGLPVFYELLTTLKGYF